MSLVSRWLSILLPSSCMVCGILLKEESIACYPCAKNLSWINAPLCTHCGVPFPSESGISHPCAACLGEPPLFDWHRSLLLYEEPVTRLLHAYKYGARLGLASFFAGRMAESMADELKNADYLIPVPLAMARLRSRTYNQSLVLAQKISKLIGIPVLIHSLRKPKDTLPQTRLSREARLKNLKDVFSWNGDPHQLQGKKVVIVDDVFTTGSTLSQCARVIRQMRPSEVGAVTVTMNPRQFR